ncbi:sensor histidine kinase [Acidaminobacter hydrogenoformans]|uniref:histidine kinase n=1 Tax=Acidaminobacter hydrogenoformans DSM 2784 TaxID=1120920 RepID=A0A1G5RSZ9_9FIRM|nr:histidine kinase dimerization/phospho-acceptor domain-containing protein [Acidaminobacter hydrogenoformans]SCZ77235.1 Signal transduction histidine kinase [Acidaminobacter hydrogenoformans DSM 2784]
MRTIYLRLSMLYVVILLISYAFIVIGVNIAINSLMVSQKQTILLEKAMVFQQIYSDSAANGILDVNRLEIEVQSLENYLGAQVLLVDRQGRVFMSDANVTDLIEEAEISSQDLNQLYSGEIIQKRTSLNQFGQDQYLLIGYPIIIKAEVEYVLFLIASIPEISMTARDVNIAVAIGLALSAIVALFMLFSFSRAMSREIKDLNEIAKHVTSGNFDMRIQTRRQDEIGELAVSLNTMAEALMKLEETKQNFIANLSHDLRSPLQSIIGYTKALLDGTSEPDKQEKYLLIVLNESERLTKLVNDILDLSKIQSGHLVLKKMNFDLHALILNELDKFEGRIEQKALKVVVDFMDEGCQTYADYASIQRVFQNLIDNAVKFVDQGGKIEIKTELHDQKVLISLRNTGTVLLPEELQEIWQRFSKLDKSRSQHRASPGLGLAIVREIIKAHDERIEVLSTPEVGVLFQLTLPFVSWQG